MSTAWGVSTAVLGLASAGLLGLVAAPPAAAEDPECSTGDPEAAVVRLDPGTPVLAQLGVPAAQSLVRDEAPEGQRPVRVAVLDSGVTGSQIPVAEHHTQITGRTVVTSPHGTTVAGLIAGRRGDTGPVGIAPDAEIVDVRVYDVADEETYADEGEVLSSDSLAAGLEWVAANADRLDIRVANVSVVVEGSPRLRAAVRAVRAEDVVVVAAAGNRPDEGMPFDELFGDDAPEPDEDAARDLFPTGYGDVVSVSATADGAADADASAYVLRNSHTTVAAPTFGAVSYGLNGAPCRVSEIATSWAAAEVSGVLALLGQMYPGDTDEQLVARLVSTANGTADHPTPLLGAGVVQPYEALTRPLAPSRSGEVERTVAVDRDTAPAAAPGPEADPLAGPREDAVWWGLIGGGVLVMALLLRPVLARRRP